MRLKNSNFHEMKINDKLIRLHPGLGEIGVCVGGTDGCGGTRQDQGLSGFSLGVLGWRVFIVTGGGGGGGRRRGGLWRFAVLLRFMIGFYVTVLKGS